MFEQEYRDVAGSEAIPPVLSLESFLKHQITKGIIPSNAVKPDTAALTIISHCTEQAVRPGSAEDWTAILRHLGVQADAGKAGCCGMAGLFGHEKEHADLSASIFAQNWASKAEGNILATGFSCRCQTKRLAGRRPAHPVEILVSHLQMKNEKDFLTQ